MRNIGIKDIYGSLYNTALYLRSVNWVTSDCNVPCQALEIKDSRAACFYVEMRFVIAEEMTQQLLQLSF